MDFYEKYFLLNLKDYPSLGIDLEINKILLYILVGSILALAFLGYRKAGVSAAVKAILRRGATDEESAKTLDELKVNTFAVRSILRTSGGRISKLILRVGARKYTYEEYVKLTKKRTFKEEKIDFATAKFYIPKEKSDEAKKIYERSDSPLFHTLLASVLLVALFVCLVFAMPEILELADSLFS